MSDFIGTGSELLIGTDSFARSNLHRAVCIEDEEKAMDQVNSLLASGMNPNRQDRFGQTPVHLAARADRTGVLEALLAAGGCPLLGDLACLSAIDVAARSNSTSALRLFSMLLDSDVQQEDEPPKAKLDFWRRGTVLVSVPNGVDSGSCSDVSFHSCTSHTRNWVLSTAQYHGCGAVDASADCSVCSLAAAQPDQLVNSGNPIVGAGSTRPQQAADSPHTVHSEDGTQNIALGNNLMNFKFPETKSRVDFGLKSEGSRSVWFEQAENNEQQRQPQDSVVSDEKEEYVLPMILNASGLEIFEGKQISVKHALKDVYEYESSVDHNSVNVLSLSNLEDGKTSSRAVMDLDEHLPLTPVSLCDENELFCDQIKMANFNSNLGTHNYQNNVELINNCENVAVACPLKKSIRAKSKSKYDDCLTTEQNGTKPGPEVSFRQIFTSVSSDHHETDPPHAPIPDKPSKSRAECSQWEPSSLVEQDLNTAFLRSDSFISFMNHTKYTNKSTSLFSGYSFYRDTEEVEAENKNSEAVHGKMDTNNEGRDGTPKYILKSEEVLSYSSHDGRSDACIVHMMTESIPLKNSESKVDNKSKQDVIAVDEDPMEPCWSNKEYFGSAPSTSLTQFDTADSSVIRKAPDVGLLNQDLSIVGKRCTTEVVYTQEQNQFNLKSITETEMNTHLGNADTPSVLVVGKPPKCGGKLKSARKRSLGVVSHKLHSPQVGGKPKRGKHTEGHSNKQTSVVEYFQTGGSAAQEMISYVAPNADEVNSQRKHSVKYEVKDVEPSELDCNALGGSKHHNCELKSNDGCSYAEKYKRLLTPPPIRKFDMAGLDSCSAPSQSSQIGKIVKGNKHLKFLASGTKTPISPSSLRLKNNFVLNTGNKLQCTPNKILKSGGNALGSANVLSNRPGSLTVPVRNPKDQLTALKSKYHKLDVCSPNIPKLPITNTPRPKIKQVLGNHLSSRCGSSNSPCFSPKKSAPYVNLRSSLKNKVKAAITAPWRPPVSIVVTEATPTARQKTSKEHNSGRAATISQKPNANCNGLTEHRKERVGSRECLDEAIMETVEVLDNASFKIEGGADNDLLESIGKCVRRNAKANSPKYAISPIKGPMEAAYEGDGIPFGLSSAVFDLVCKFNAINGVDHKTSPKKSKKIEVPSIDTAEEVQRKVECVSVPVQNLFVCSPVTPHKNIPSINNHNMIEDITINDSSSFLDQNLTSRNNVSGFNSRTDEATNKRKILTGTNIVFETRNEERTPSSSKPYYANSLLSNHTPCSDDKRPDHEPCSNVTSHEGVDYILTLPTSGASQPLPATSTDQDPSSPVLVTSTDPVLSTPGDVKVLKAATASSTVGGSSVGSALTIVEEFVYSDPECGVLLIERRCPSLASVSGTLRSLATTGSRGQAKISDPSNDSVGNAGSVLSSLPDSILRLSADTLSRELVAAGSALTGPVTETTARTYARLLHKIRQGKVTPLQLKQADCAPQYSRELRQALHDPDCVPWDSYRSLEQRMSSVFTSPRPLDYWRGGTAKVCFNYLLLDPTVTQDLPLRAASLSPAELFRVFVSAVFYVGKGCKARPYAHLYQALQEQERRREVLAKPDVPKLPSAHMPSTSSAEKVSRILRVWEAGGGVVSLHVFQHTIPAEAWTREATMIDAIGLSNLSNCVGGSYYGPARGFPNCDRKALGVVLLHRAMLMLLCEGERQLRPPDLPPNPWTNRAKKTKRASHDLSP